MDEEILVRRLQQGDREAFDALYMLHRDVVLRTACLITGNRMDGEDVTQEAFVQCYQRIGQLRDPKLFRAWLFRAMTRMAWKQCRVRRREQPVDVLFGQDTQDVRALHRAAHGAEPQAVSGGAVARRQASHRGGAVLF